MRQYPPADVQVSCFHCGQSCEAAPVEREGHSFCCQGCATVFEILNENNLCEYYSFSDKPGINRREINSESYAYLDEPSVQQRLVLFKSDHLTRVEFFVPAIHCISCIWLLENLQRLHAGVVKSQVNFSRKRVTIDFRPEEVLLSGLAALLDSLGYSPQVSLSEEKKQSRSSPALVMKLAVAGFAFGNIMLLSFPEYLGLEGTETDLKLLFSYLNLALAVPVTFYSGQEYFTNAWHSFRQRQINIDVPIAVGLAALFFRSAYDILSQTGPGYLDSLAGLVFFLLIGRWFQGKTYESLAFDRDFKSYFPLAVQCKTNGEWKPVVIYELERGDTIRVRNWEVVPADCVLVSAEALFDYSFVTGESKPVRVKAGEWVYAGGRLVGQPVEMVVEKKTSQSHLTSLWNNEVFQKPEESRYRKIIDLAARRFTWVVLGIAVVTAGYWYWTEPTQMWLVITAVLMVACPCALALAAPFTYGNMLRVMGRHGFYLKNADVIERMATIDAVVFDKTGTVTHGSANPEFIGVLEDDELAWVKRMTESSTHPLSSLIARSLKVSSQDELLGFSERPGKGMQATIHGHVVRVGSADFVGFTGNIGDLSSRVFVAIDGEVRGYFRLQTTIRSGMKELLTDMAPHSLYLLSGDGEGDRQRMTEVFPRDAALYFNQNPHEKMEFIRQRQKDSARVMMLGDGLNDSGALKQSDVGIAVTDDTGVFTPACDGILEGRQLPNLGRFLKLSRVATAILKVAFAISFFYNVIALSFAVSGHLTPLVAAILMPISSISVVGFSTLAVNFASRKIMRS
ncbi:MAG: heavy metal translocating P-type ATPase [Cyclobacteriaceae bacterium]|jgi:Cu+-exporting ATPase